MEREKTWREESLKTAEARDKALADAFLTEQDYDQKTIDLTSTAADKVTESWDAAIAKLGPPVEGFEEQWKRTADAINTYFGAKLDSMYVNEQTLTDKSRTMLQERADREYATWEAMKADPDEYSDEAIRAQKRIADAAQDAANGTKTAWETTYTDLNDLSGVLGTMHNKWADLGQIAIQTLDAVTDRLAKGDVFGAVVAGITGGIKAIADLGGPSQEELQGRQTEGSFEQQMAGTLTAQEKVAAGSNQLSQALEGLELKYQAAGYSAEESSAKAQAAFSQLFAAEKQGGTAVQTVIDGINADIEQQTTITQQRTTDIQTDVTGILDAAKTVGVNFPAALQPMVDKLLQLPGLTDDEKTALEGLDSSGTPSLQDLTNTAAKYGLTMDSLGSKTQQLDITTKADQAITDYNELTKSGADTGAVIGGMGKSISSLVDEAIKYGGTLPTALEPILQNMEQAGTLTDATGKKITDLSDIKFDDTNDPLQKSIDSLTGAMNNLDTLLESTLPGAAKTMASALTDSINGIPSDKTITLHEQVDGSAPSYAAAGGFVASRGVEYFADGGFPGMPSGSDRIPAWLSEGEAVLNRSATAGLGRDTIAAINRGGAPAAFGASVASAVPEAFAEHTREIKALRNDLSRIMQLQPVMLRHALRGAK